MEPIIDFFVDRIGIEAVHGAALTDYLLQRSARRVATNIAKLSSLLRKNHE
jgi:hypothetical protein